MTELDKDALEAAFRAADEAAPTGRAYAPAIKAAICAYLGAADDWRPMESAPKDGTEVLLAIPNPYKVRGDVEVAWWFSDWENWQIGAEPDPTKDELFGIGSNVPRAWRPLPSPPKEG